MPADARLAVLADDAPALDEQEAAVVGVRDRKRAVRQRVRVVGSAQVGAVRARFSGASEQHLQAVVCEVHLDDRVVVLLVGDQRPATWHHERVVVVHQPPPHAEVFRSGVEEHDLALRVHDDDAVVAAIGDEDVAGRAGKLGRGLVCGRGAGLHCDHVLRRPQRREATDRGRRDRSAVDDRRRVVRPSRVRCGFARTAAALARQQHGCHDHEQRRRHGAPALAVDAKATLRTASRPRRVHHHPLPFARRGSTDAPALLGGVRPRRIVACL